MIITGILYIKYKANNQYQILTDNIGSSLTDTSWVKNKYLNIPYALILDAQKLDIYLPNGKNFAKPYPVIVVSVNYRLANEAKFPAQIQDITATIRFVKANINKYNLNPNAISVWEDYADANLAALACYIWKQMI